MFVFNASTPLHSSPSQRFAAQITGPTWGCAAYSALPEINFLKNGKKKSLNIKNQLRIGGLVIEITDKINEGASPNPLNQNKSDLANGQPLKGPEGSAQTAFQKFAAGAEFATPSGVVKDPPRKKKKGRPRKHPKKISFNPDSPGASTVLDPLTAVPAAQDPQPIAKKPVDFSEFTAPFLGMASATGANWAGNKAWALTKDETKELATALNPVINEFLPNLEQMDPKTAAILGFAMVAVSIYHKKAIEIENGAAQKQNQVVESQTTDSKTNSAAPT